MVARQAIKDEYDDCVLDGRLPRAHRDTLVEMNKAVFTARRNAAHNRVVDILRRDIIASPKERRTELYALCLILLEETLRSSRRSQVKQDTPVTHYLEMLCQTVGASAAVLKHEMTLIHEAVEFTELQEDASLKNIPTTNDVFSDGEMNLLDCIDGLIRFGTPILNQDSEQRKATFSDDEKRRFELAQKEYSDYYQHFNEG